MWERDPSLTKVPFSATPVKTKLTQENALFLALLSLWTKSHSQFKLTTKRANERRVKDLVPIYFSDNISLISLASISGSECYSE